MTLFSVISAEVPVEWNVLVTAIMRKERSLLRFLREYGDFKGSGFRDVIIGAVENRDAFLETIESLRREHPESVRHLSQIVPLEKTFQFDVSDFREKKPRRGGTYNAGDERTVPFHKGEMTGEKVRRCFDRILIIR